MTSLADQLRERIKAEGPITVEAYMAVCNAHYYATRDPLGEAGDQGRVEDGHAAEEEQA